jgi:membrane dipeptidase
MLRRLSARLLASALVLAACSRPAPGPKDNLVPEPDARTLETRSAPPSESAPSSADAAAARLARAREIAHRVIILNGHIDVPYRLEKSRARGDEPEDVTRATERGDFDLPRAREGGLDAAFMSIYVPASREEDGDAKIFADRLIDSVERMVARAPDALVLARSPADVRAAVHAGKISVPLGMENGAPIEGELANLAYFHGRGIRYITLTHSRDNHISDSSFDTRRTHGGLSEFGRRVVTEMNRLGIMIDVSHLSDDAFWQVIELSRAPVIASHSSCRKFTPGFERNMSDEMIRALAKRDGVIQINFGSSFLDGELREAWDEQERTIKALLADEQLAPGSTVADERIAAWRAAHPRRYARVSQVADHIEHVIELVGVEHVGLGSDFDGVGDSLPVGLKDVSMYPNLLSELLARGLDEPAIEKIAGANVLRVWQAVEDYARARAPEREDPRTTAAHP